MRRGRPRFHDFEVEAGTVGHDASVAMDGQQLRGVRSVSLSTGVHDLTEITITMVGGSINRPSRWRRLFGRK